jgi:hypothetical protein
MQLTTDDTILCTLYLGATLVILEHSSIEGLGGDIPFVNQCSRVGPCARIWCLARRGFSRRALRDSVLRGPVAQLAEQQTLNLRVVGSIPTRLTIESTS